MKKFYYQYLTFCYLFLLLLSGTFIGNAQEIPTRIGNTLSPSKATAKTAAVSALAAAGSIDVANASYGYNGYTPDLLVRNILTSGCLSISNVRFGYYKRSNNNWNWVNHNWSTTAGDRQLGYYNKATSTFPIDEGILLSTGKISSAMGPNSYTNRSDELVNEASDPDLTNISGETMHDAAILEFNFIPDGNLVEFKFVFASEEYLEYVHTDYNDAFGFFLSGSGINGPYTNNAINLAQLPNGDAVTINNIHSSGTNVNNVSFPNHNVAYYANNPAGSATMEYDGSTVVLTATYAVTPGQNYKIKMAIADASDQKWDAGVFLKAKSFATNTLVITNPAPVCANGTANLTLPAITAGSTSGLTYTYWTNSTATTPLATPSAAPVGTYYIKGTNAESGCSDIKPVVVSQTNIVITETTASHIDVKCKGAATGSATVTASGGTGSYNYSWNTSPVQTNATATNLSAGTYTVTVTDSKGCSNTKQISITEPTTSLAASTTQVNLTCNGGTNGSATVTATGGMGTYTYSWNTTPVQTSATASNLAAGTYTVIVKDANLCQVTKTVTITGPTAALALGASSKTDASCFGKSTGSVTAGTVTNAVGTVNYSWKNSSNAVVGTAATVSNLPAGTYTLTVTDSCSSQSNSVTIGQPAAALALGASSKTDASCFGKSTGSVTAGTVTNAVGTVSYSWKNGNVEVGTSATVSNLPAGTYTLTVTDSCSSQSNSVTIGQPAAALALGASSKTDASCFGKSTGSVTAGTVTNAVGTITYSWKNGNVEVGTSATVSNLPAGTYTLTVTDSCSSQSNSVTIGQPAAALALGASSKTDASCFGKSTGSVTAGTVTNAVGTITYSWKNSSNAVVGTAATVSNLPAGTYTLTVTDSCSSQSNSVTIGQPAAALALGASSKTDASCFGKSTGSVTAGTVTNAVGTITYSWKNSSNAVVGTAATVSNLPAGTYTLTVTDSCSSQSNSVTIGQPAAALALGASSKTDASCFGKSTGSVTAGTVTNAVGTVSYSWKNGNVEVGTSATVSNLPAGTYTLTVTDSCSSQSNSVTIGQPAAALALGASSKTDASCFGKSTGSVTAGTVTNAVGTVSYSWKNGNTEVGTSATVSNLPAGTYTLTVTDSCSSQSNSVTIGQPAAALALGASSKTDASCFGKSTGSVTAGTVTNAVGTITYSWKNSSNAVVGTAATVSNLPAGTYTLTVTDSCSSQSNSVTIGQPAAALALGASSKTDASCFGKSTGSVTAGTVTNAVGTITYSWKNGNVEVGTSATVSNLPAGTYTLTVTDSCSSQSNSVTIGQPAAALALGASSKTDASCFGKSTGSVTAGTVTNAVGTITYSWKNSSNAVVGTAATVSNLPAGTYTLTVTDSCSSQSNSVTIGQPAAALALGTSSKTDASCFGKSTGSVTAGTVTNAVGAVSYSWTNSLNAVVGTAATVSNLPAGTYTLTVTDSCSSQSNSVTIGQPAAALALGTSSKTDVFCFGASTGTVTAGTVTNAIGTVNYSWTNSSNAVVGTAATVSNLPAGIYTLTITDSCSSQSNSVTIGQPAIALSCSVIQNKSVTSNGLSDGEATVTPIGGNVGYTYLWDNNETTQKALGLNAGLHTVTVTDSKGCTTTCTVTITQPNVLSCSISQDSAVKCFGGNTGKATVTAVGGNGEYTYLWDNSETSAQAVALTAGLHTVTVTDKLGYTTNCSVTISQPQKALSAIKSQTDVTCGGGNNGSATVTVSGGTAQYNYSWNSVPVQITATASNLAAGNYTVLITDANGCTLSESFTILDGDSIKPIVNPLPEVTTINCPAVPVFAQATATDNNGTISSLTFEDTIIQGNCAGSYTKTRTWTAKDACGNISLPVSQTIIVQDNTAPIWATQTGSLDKTVECSDTQALASAQALFPSASDACDADVSNIIKVSGKFTASEGCGNAGTYTNTWTVKDDCENTSETFTQVITIQDTAAPTWTTAAGTLNATLECSDTQGLAAAQAQFPIASDSCDADVSNITKVSGQFVASEGCGNAGTYTNTWTVKDDCGNTSETFTQVITIQDTAAPTWTTAAGSLNATLECSDTQGLATAQAQFPIASDSCDADVSNITKISGQFVASEGCGNAGTYTNTWTVKDDCGNTSETFTQVITIQDTAAPTWTTASGTLNATLECSDTQGLATAQAQFPIASDSCDADVSNITKVSGQFIASEGCGNAGTYTNTWTVKDDCGNTSETFTQVITIQDTAAPTWTTASGTLNATLECSDTQGLATAQAQFPIASDSCDADVSNITKVSGQFVASENCSNAGTYTNTWTVKDDCGNTSETFTQVITIQDTAAPTWTTAAGTLNATLECSDTQGLAAAQAQFPIASDSCDADVSNITKVSGQFVASENCSNAGTYTNTWTVKDDCGNTSETFTQVITIQDTTAPMFTGDLPLDIEVSCDAVPESAEMHVSDNCNDNLPIVFSEVKSGIENECSTNYTLTRTWKISDCGGNTTTHVQIITVRDKTAPTGTAPESITNLASIDLIPAGNPSDIKDAADNCSSTVNITVSDTNNEGNGCDGTPYILTRTYTLTDCAGNKTELVQTFTVESKVTVSGVATNTSCFGGSDGKITVTNSPGSIVVITNERNEVVGNTNLPAGTYTLTATALVNGENQTCSATATVVISQPEYTVKISGQVINVDTNTPLANVPVTLIPQGTTPGAIQMRITGTDGMYSFSGMPAGSYLVQVQDANLNSAHQLYPVDSSLFFTTLEDCKVQTHNFEYGKSTLPVLGDYVWYDLNNNGIQDEWYDANNDGVVTKNIPDSNGSIDYSQWEWIDLNGDGSYTGPENNGELNAAGFGNALSSNIIVDGPNGYHADVIVGIEGFWRERPETANPYGDYTIKLVRDANFDAVAAALGATGLVKVIPSSSAKNISGKTSKMQMHTVCQTTTDAGYVVTVTPEDLVHLDIDFGVSCKEYKDIVANDDSAGPIAGVNHTTTNVLNVLTNDTLEGAAITASDVIITTVTPNEFLQLNPDGSVDVLPNAPVGTLTMVYQICEADQTDNCDTATVTITIEAPVMTVTATSICVNDVPYVDYVVTPVNFTPVNGVTIAWADSNNNVVTTMTNLPLSGRVLWPGAVVDGQGKGIDWPGWIFENNKWIEAADGFEKLRPTANLTVSVNPSETITLSYPPADPFCTARPTFAIVATYDNPAPITGPAGQTNIVNVLTNDTLNGSSVNINDVTLTTTVPDPTGALTLNPDGSVNVAPNTPGGTYTLTYQICEKADFGNCDSAIVTVVVLDPPAPPTPVVANDDTYSNIGCNSFGLVGNVLSNDTKGITRASLELVNFTLLTEATGTKSNPNITFDGSGNVTVSSLTPAGTYTYSYRICDKLSSENCDTATVTIIVVPNGVTQTSATACNDDSTLVNLSSLLPEGSPSTGTWIDKNNTNALQGTILNPFGLALGNYVFEYAIADEKCPRSIVLNMEINDDCKVLACGDVLVHNAFSPNGDNKNDFFKIDNIDDTTCYPSNSVEIYNRWGILVFETTNYNNTTNAFDGTSRGRTTVKQSDGLPTGTYFYIINYKSLDGNNNVQDHKLDGYLYLSK
ncbi:choice-of-anchor L domain-containing protein [Flavobacterium luteolum]|uniref:choice-of-anchor L domain-containing protein n=1 Tax=Flavobacterium luteolum TaxID=3003259 RepID=UPI00248E5716|nr:choice-of-anchor L domain-containing protein [Flavobacterium luteolum]